MSKEMIHTYDHFVCFLGRGIQILHPFSPIMSRFCSAKAPQIGHHANICVSSHYARSCIVYHSWKFWITGNLITFYLYIAFDHQSISNSIVTDTNSIFDNPILFFCQIWAFRPLIWPKTG